MLNFKSQICFVLIIFLTMLNNAAHVAGTIVDVMDRQEVRISQESNNFTIFCYNGLSPKVYRLWNVASFYIRHASNVKFYQGPNATSVQTKKDNENTIVKSFVSSFFSNTPTNNVSIYKTFFDTFSYSCVGLESSSSYVALMLTKVEPIFVVVTFLGIALFFLAKKFSRNLAFYYASGISFSMLASILVIVLIVHRMLPIRRGLYAFLAMGGSLSLVLFQRIFSHFGWLLSEYRVYLLSYLGTVGFISFSFIYWYGPPVDSPRTVQLVQWSLQLLSLLVIYSVIQIPACGVAVIFLLILLDRLSAVSLTNTISQFRTRFLYRLFPPKRRLLSQEEYSVVTAEATQRSLEELRQFCQSPKCNAWLVISSLKSPGRMASFVEDGSHITPEELDLYDQSSTLSLTDEEDLAMDTIHTTLRPGRQVRCISSSDNQRTQPPLTTDSQGYLSLETEEEAALISDDSRESLDDLVL